MINFRAEMLIRLICRVNQGYMHQKHVKFEAYDCLVKLWKILVCMYEINPTIRFYHVFTSKLESSAI